MAQPAAPQQPERPQPTGPQVHISGSRIGRWLGKIWTFVKDHSLYTHVKSETRLNQVISTWASRAGATSETSTVAKEIVLSARNIQGGGLPETTAQVVEKVNKIATLALAGRGPIDEDKRAGLVQELNHMVEEMVAVNKEADELNHTLQKLVAQNDAAIDSLASEATPKYEKAEALIRELETLQKSPPLQQSSSRQGQKEQVVQDPIATLEKLKTSLSKLRFNVTNKEDPYKTLETAKAAMNQVQECMTALNSLDLASDHPVMQDILSLANTMATLLRPREELKQNLNKLSDLPAKMTENRMKDLELRGCN